jgi:hypothetical protein
MTAAHRAVDGRTRAVHHNRAHPSAELNSLRPT